MTPRYPIHSVRTCGSLKLEQQPAQYARAAEIDGDAGDIVDHRFGALGLNKEIGMVDAVIPQHIGCRALVKRVQQEQPRYRMSPRTRGLCFCGLCLVAEM